MPTQITEAAKVASRGPGKILLTLITPGQGSSGYYSEEVLAKAAEEKAFPRGTMGMVNHDTEMERADRPEGDLRNLIWVTLEDAYVDANGDLVAETRVLSAWRDFVEETHEFIGASISASAAVRDTKEGRIVERLIPSPFNRVDAVTVAGRGGQVSEILEAARVIESRSIIANEVTADDIEVYISHAVQQAHADRENDVWAWLENYDDTYAYFRKERTSFRQSYTRDGVNVTLNGEPEAVLRRTEYDPVGTTTTAESIQLTAPTTTNKLPAPAGQESSPKLAEANQIPNKETTMAEIAEERLQLLEESHGQLQAIKAREADKDNTIAELNENLAKARAFNRAQEFAKTIVTGANSELSESVVARIVTASVHESDLPLTEALQLDTDALTETVNKAREAEETYLAQLAKENGLGQVRGVGETKSTDVTESSDADIANELKGL
ncbi:hypothetical protein [Glutamicibacter sp. FBE19]|uniref:hypothetical protein n=1 Tax=Glutamicibacter sp. FBE19 TaxID=2761534 RepID=UPI0018964407|nr:hypothetical protein [Glutamicibacter sp. FBE19]MBF6671590.1 hypothetical protein [Glutamicibacter sp. FBE19]